MAPIQNVIKSHIHEAGLAAVSLGEPFLCDRLLEVNQRQCISSWPIVSPRDISAFFTATREPGFVHCLSFSGPPEKKSLRRVRRSQPLFDSLPNRPNEKPTVCAVPSFTDRARCLYMHACMWAGAYIRGDRSRKSEKSFVCFPNSIDERSV